MLDDDQASQHLIEDGLDWSDGYPGSLQFSDLSTQPISLTPLVRDLGTNELDVRHFPPRFVAYPLLRRGCRAMPNHPRYAVVLLNDNETLMDFVVRVLEVFFEMRFAEACTLMFRVHEEGKAICGTYSREEAQKKVADILAFADEHKFPLTCILEEADWSCSCARERSSITPGEWNHERLVMTFDFYPPAQPNPNRPELAARSEISDGDHVRLITKGGNNWTDRHPWGVRRRAIRKEKAGQENSG
jgi:ATP-dependent Clp protease adaptor protein ClpS